MTRLTDEQRDLAERHRPLAFWIAGKFKGRGVEWCDLESEALFALIDAASRFDPDRGCKFSTFSYPRIHGALATMTWRKRSAQWPALLEDEHIPEIHDSGYRDCEIHDLIARLPDRPRRVIVGKFFEDKTGAQLAKEFGVSEMAVSKYLHKGLDLLRREVTA
jgi:RNA polymerase sigma factor (sigma-70 family)